MEQIQEFIEVLKTALIFGITLSGLVVLIVQRVKERWFPDGGAIIKYIAIGSGTVLGSIVLFFLYPLEAIPFDYFGVIARIVAAFLWAWTAPFGYELMTETSAKGAETYIHGVEERATLGGSVKDE